MFRVMRAAVDSDKVLSDKVLRSAGERPSPTGLLSAPGSIDAIASPILAPRRRGTIAISAALIVTVSFTSLALVIEPSSPPGRLDLHKSLMPPEFSCADEICGRPAAEAVAAGLRGR
jgi:hypothetical protein